MIRAACYERVSTEEQAQHGYSIESQIAALDAYARSHEYKIVGHYTDEGFTAGKSYLKRPAMKRLLQDVQDGKIDLILFTKLDRWYRNTKEYYKTQEILEKHKCDWKTTLEEYDTTTANGRMVIGIMLSINQQERERTSERIKFVFESKHRQGEYTSSVAPYGYKVDTVNGKRVLIKDPDTQEAFEECFATLIRTKCHAEARRVLLDNGISMGKNKFSELIRTGRYITGEHNGNPDFCPAYISKEDLASVQKPIRKTQGGRYYLFTGLIPCEKCGRILCATYKFQTTQKYGTRQYLTYRCRFKNEKCENNSSISEIKLERQLLDSLSTHLDAYIADVEAKQIERKKKGTSRVPQLKEKLRRVNESYFAGNLEDDEYKTLASIIKKQIAEAEQELPPPEPDLSPIKQLANSNYRELYSNLTQQEKQRFWRNLISAIHLKGHDIDRIDFKA